ncbi:sulfurtransferase [Sandaracinus amylolyticus]|uniref:sulfurtransferase n=1 Tax=Sandaracinus amylolyticus TaxID=927083 RepID=UPI001F1D4158|nr:sulfurtransferase [Sandaracinus amylolyticus]UJR85049.1 Hypothetical protein I5071_71280 [Sandaracinus amylolyticus]
MSLDPIVDPRTLVARQERANLVLVDARSGKDSRERFEAGHLEGARHVDLDRGLTAHVSNPAHGGRHPLPDPQMFARVLAWLGVSSQKRIVIYDDKGGANAAARFWWMLRATGHPRVQVIDGGYDAAVAAGIPVVRGPSEHSDQTTAPIGGWASPLADIDEVARATRDAGRLVLDVRDPARYRGETDPFDPDPGHIPGAVNVPFASNLDAGGRFLSRDELAAKYRALIGDREPGDVIVSCGSGVTACHTLLAMEHAGLPGAKLYVGSFSEWTRSGRPVAKGDQRG